MVDKFFNEAFKQAHLAIKENSGGPFGAVVVHRDRIIGRGRNTVLRDHDPTAHAEMNAIREAAVKIKKHNLGECFLVSTSEPCPMCLMAAHWADLQKIYYAAPNFLAGQYGFRDEKLAQMINNSHIRAIEVDGFYQQAVDLFELWKEQGGQVY